MSLNRNDVTEVLNDIAHGLHAGEDLTCILDDLHAAIDDLEEIHKHELATQHTEPT